MRSHLRILTSALLIPLLSSCVPNYHYSFLDEAHSLPPTQQQIADGAIDFHKAPRLTDALAVNYALSVSELLRAKYNGSRIARETTSTIQVGLAALTASSAAFGLNETTIAALGLGGTIIPGLQDIYKAKDRALVFQEAADLIDKAVIEYYLYNPLPSTEYITPNGVKILQRVSGSVNLVEKTLANQLPTMQEMRQAVALMDTSGATKQTAGSAPVSHVTADGSEVGAVTPVITQEQIDAINRAARHGVNVGMEEWKAEFKEALVIGSDEAKALAAEWNAKLKKAHEGDYPNKDEVYKEIASYLKKLDPSSDLGSTWNYQKLALHFTDGTNLEKQKKMLEILTTKLGLN